MRSVYVLFHTAEAPLADEDRLIAVFSDQGEAVQAIETLRAKPGFRDSPQGFGLDEYELDKDYWQEGFAWDDDKSRTGALSSDILDCLPVDADSNVFVLEHRSFVGMHENKRLIGFYSSHPNATSGAYRLSVQPGFRSFTQGFFVYGLSLNEIHWMDGFEPREAYLHQLLTCSLPSRSGPTQVR